MLQRQHLENLCQTESPTDLPLRKTNALKTNSVVSEHAEDENLSSAVNKNDELHWGFCYDTFSHQEKKGVFTGHYINSCLKLMLF